MYTHTPYYRGICPIVAGFVHIIIQSQYPIQTYSNPKSLHCIIRYLIQSLLVLVSSNLFPIHSPAFLQPNMAIGHLKRLGFPKSSNYPLVMSNIAIENDHRNGEFSHEKLWFSIVMFLYQRVCICIYIYMTGDFQLFPIYSLCILIIILVG